MKNFIQYLAASLLFAFAMSPVLVMAQEANMYNDGSSDWGSGYGERVRGYRYQSSDLQQKINALPSVANASVLMPVLFGVGVHSISPNFGDPRSGGRSHEGEDIMAIKGTPIISPTPAVVLRAGEGGSEGIYVYTANPGGETFVYYHLDRIGEGVVPGLVLAQGSLIGYVGNTGNASGGAAHLHFEIHDSSGNPTDPFPRLTTELTMENRMLYLSTILNQITDSKTLVQFLIDNFRSAFTLALAQGITLPAMANSLLISDERGISGSGADLEVGSSGAAVIVLQRYLIQANSGSAAGRLAAAGATGNFGPITRAALVEFQLVKGIIPANGYYGPATRAYVVAHPLGITPPPLSPTIPASSGSSVPLTRDLRYGMTGADVRTLQILLNSKGLIVAVTGAGSSGKETNYFGPATMAAVQRFQVSRSIGPANGNVGPFTRAALLNL